MHITKLDFSFLPFQQLRIETIRKTMEWGVFAQIGAYTFTILPVES